MSEISISKKAFGLSCVSHFFHFFFFLLSHPLHLSFFIFFFPYFLKLLSFLSPLFITTFLLLFALFSLFDHHLHHHFHHFADSSKMGFLATTYHVVFDSLRPRTPDESPMEELEAYKIVFEAYTFDSVQNPYEHSLQEVEVEVDFQEPMEHFPEKIKTLPENPLIIAEVEAKTEELQEAKFVNRDEKHEIMNDLKESSSSSRSESSPPWSSPGSFGRDYSSLGSYGSMRKEKEWRRTLACKLFEERHSSEETEGMDSLWETYEKKEKDNRKSKKEEEEEEEEEEGQLCCLQALKFSAGKMNLGMRRPNLMKMTKALKGFGWLSRKGSRKRLIH